MHFRDKQGIDAHTSVQQTDYIGGKMANVEETANESVASPVADSGSAQVDDVATAPKQPTTVHEGRTEAARILELAAMTADRLVADAETEAKSLVTAARADADATLEASRTEAQRAAAELARSRDEQTAELDRERATALAGLAEEKAALEERIATLRQMQDDHRTQMRDHLNEQLARLDATMPEPPPSILG